MSMDNNRAGFGRARLSAGTRLNGIYEIDRPIGMGGMGEIYYGHVIETGDPVAIKVLLPEFADNAAALTLFRKEASALHYVHHDAVVRYFVFSVEPVLERPYLAMEYVDGRSLFDILESDGPLTFEAVQSLSQRLANGLQAAHDRGIVHRDVSPENIIIPGGDVARAKIIDFGIARSTQHGTVIGSGFAGKFNYVSPEQLGLFGGNVTAKSDIYSLALVLVHALNGHPIDMGGSQVDVVEKRRKLPDLGAIDMRIRPLLEKMLQPDPANRPDSMLAVAASSLGAAAPGARQGIDLRRTTAAAPDPRRARRRWIYAAASVSLILLTGGAGVYYYYGVAAPVAPPPPSPRLDQGAGLDPATPGTSATPGASVVTPGESVTAEKIRKYIEQYNGGECFFVWPVAVSETAAVVEGFGASGKPFTVLNDDFHRDIGFEADIGVRQVTQPQCPAVSFLNRVRSERARAPRLDIDKVKLRSGDMLGGMIDRYGERNVDLVLVSDVGTVRYLSEALKAGTDAKTFNIGMRRTEGGPGSQPQLLMAIASASPLATLRPAQPAAADEFFRKVLDDAARTGQSLSATARYFMLEK
jgi:serine/threonine protein kinase, bacterial